MHKESSLVCHVYHTSDLRSLPEYCMTYISESLVLGKRKVTSLGQTSDIKNELLEWTIGKETQPELDNLSIHVYSA